MNFFKNLFKPPPTIQERVKEMQKSLTQEIRNIDRQIRKIELEERKIKIDAKKIAKQNKLDCVRILAKEIVHTKKALKRLRLAKSHIFTINMQLNIQLSQINMTKSLAKNTQIMKMMNSLCKVQLISDVMQNMSKEMIKMNLIEETINDQMDDVFDDIEEGDVDEEVNKVVDELLMDVKKTQLPSNELIVENNENNEDVENDNNEDAELTERLNKLAGA
jgi:charged multivesicular body protein 3